MGLFDGGVGGVALVAGSAVRAFRARRDVVCTAMKSCKGKLRPRVMFYADEDVRPPSLPPSPRRASHPKPQALNPKP